ncbi:MAG: lipase [Verrucomicrobia bacterium]|nr:lipase [Verrucomicrobiota bacterium]MCH8527472.1 GDSL-type esterase/lipase family protein [Kiritimatiellia bacterium]
MPPHPIEFHNTAETVPHPSGGLVLRRFPAAIQSSLSPLGRIVSEESAGCEIRFVSESDSVRVDLSAIPSGQNGPLQVTVFKGGFLHSVHALESGKINHLVLSDIGGEVANRFLTLAPEARDTSYFHHRVWRILIGRFTAVFHGVQAYGDSVRPPLPSEKPARRLLCYGSSITNGATPNLHHLSYIYIAGRRLGWDVLNKGISGSCRLEPALADSFAAETSWDAAFLELGVNMRRGTSPHEFRKLAAHFIRTLISAHPEKPVFLTTIFLNGNSTGIAAVTDEVQQAQEAFDQILRELHVSFQHPCLHLLEGRSLLTRADQLTPDLIHPSDYGHQEMGINLANALRQHLS